MNLESHVTPDGNRKPTSQRSAGDISAVFCDSSTDLVLTLCGPGRDVPRRIYHRCGCRGWHVSQERHPLAGRVGRCSTAAWTNPEGVALGTRPQLCPVMGAKRVVDQGRESFRRPQPSSWVSCRLSSRFSP